VSPTALQYTINSCITLGTLVHLVVFHSIRAPYIYIVLEVSLGVIFEIFIVQLVINVIDVFSSV